MVNSKFYGDAASAFWDKEILPLVSLQSCIKEIMKPISLLRLYVKKIYLP